MTYQTITHAPLTVTVYPVDGELSLAVGPIATHLDQTQARELALYLLEKTGASLEDILLYFAEHVDADLGLVKPTEEGDDRTWTSIVQEYLATREN